MIKMAFLNEERQVGFDWHLGRARRWLEYDNGRQLDNVLVYASFELRCAIERYFFELLYILRNGNLSSDDESKCRSEQGISDLIKETEPNYRKLAIFSNIVASLMPGTPSIVIVDFKFLKKKWHDLSECCHAKLRADKTFGSSQREFQKKGFTFIYEVLNKFEEWHRRSALGILRKEYMPAETRSVYEKFEKDEIDEGQARTMLHLITPILAMRETRRASPFIELRISNGRT